MASSLGRAAAPARQAPRYAEPPVKSAPREYAEAFLLAIALAVFIRTFFIQAYKIPSSSMVPTLLIGDHIMVNKVAYGLRFPDSLLGLRPLEGELPYDRYLFRFHPVRRGDVVVFVFPGDPSKDFIKRVIAIGGDTVAVHNGAVYLDGRRLPDPHAHLELAPQARTADSPRDNFGPVKVPPGKLFMMGDNRDRSYDSRFWGFVDQNQVEGRAMFIYWSWSDDDSWFPGVRWSRIGKLIH